MSFQTAVSPLILKVGAGISELEMLARRMTGGLELRDTDTEMFALFICLSWVLVARKELSL